jgi:DNA processing protein
VAVVGSRRCSMYGREQAERFGSLLAGVGITVVSGGAAGVDSSAHRGALRQPHGRTIAVLGSGLDRLYPRENHELFLQISQRGAVISEFPLGTPPNAENFPRRNRLISGLSRGVLVVEADERSGALITARLAADDHGRPVFAMPGRVDNPLSAGPHQLISDGAVLTRNLDDILAELGPLPDTALSQAPPAEAGEPLLAGLAPPGDATLSPRQSAVLEAVQLDPTSVDQIVERTGLPAGEVLGELTFLTLRSLVRRVDGQAYCRKGKM